MKSIKQRFLIQVHRLPSPRVDVDNLDLKDRALFLRVRFLKGGLVGKIIRLRAVQFSITNYKFEQCASVLVLKAIL